jgi:hypothetical protein
MNINDYLAAYLVTNDEKVLNNIQNFIDISVAKANKRIRGAFFEVIATSPTLPPDLVAIKWLTVNGELYLPSLVANEATYNVAAGRLSITPALTGADALEFCFYQVNAAVMATATPAVLIHGAAAEALMFQGNQEGALAETALFQKDLDDCLGWEQHGTISQGRSNAAGAPVSPAAPPLPYLTSDMPVMDGAGTPGASVQGARGDHQHPVFDGDMTLTGLNVTGDTTLEGGATLGGDLAFTGTGNRITGDFSNSNIANRVAFKTSIVNGVTSVAALPDGSNTAANVRAFGGSDPLNAPFIDIVSGPTEQFLRVNKTGTGASTPLAISVLDVERARFAVNGEITFGGTAAAPALKINNVAGQNRWVTVTPSNGGNPTISTSGGSLAVDANIVALSYIQGYRDSGIPVGGVGNIGIGVGTTGIGFYIGSGPPTATLAAGSIYLRTDGGPNTRIYSSAGGGVWHGMTSAT